MSEQIDQFILGKFTVNVVHEGEKVTYFSATEKPDTTRTRLLTWKQGVGFKTRLVTEDPQSDLETVVPIEASEFPDVELLRLLREPPAELSTELAGQIIAALRKRNL
jgi:hypothetical protein